ncbi:uncharacterized protein LOC112597645 [Melanaphis sacchari]|uniref:uncharacterized protein LOC112597645 n=1 Tax=Melanaphis sacchari TaxID=742174 RepID=UPI000DC14394|nr:uncharacterized protein LOC112597645 [Melanaphis sacchari]
MVGMIKGLALLPLKYVKKGMSVLYDLSKDFNDPDIDELLLYFDKTYVNGTYKRTTTQSNGLSFWRSSPIFPPYLWNVHNATKKNTGRTNNICEGFNNKFKTLVELQHQIFGCSLKTTKVKFNSN